MNLTTTGWGSFGFQDMFYEEIVSNRSVFCPRSKFWTASPHTLYRTVFLWALGFVPACQAPKAHLQPSWWAAPVGEGEAAPSWSLLSSLVPSCTRRTNPRKRNVLACKIQLPQAAPPSPGPPPPTLYALWLRRAQKPSQFSPPTQCSVGQSQPQFSNTPRPTWKLKQATATAGQGENSPGCLQAYAGLTHFLTLILP